MNKTTKIIIAFSVAVIIFLGYIIFDRKSSVQTNEVASIGEQAAQNNNSNQPDSSQLSVGQAPANANEPATSTASALTNNMHIITIKTNLGEIQFSTYDADAPKTVKNFIDLAEKGFYNGLTFHRVIDGFMIQGGDPNGNGSGGPGYSFADELNPATQSYQQGYLKGVVAMANAGHDTNGSQFFIMVANYPLAHDYTIFGRVTKGQEVADKIAKVAKDANDKPLSPVIMQQVTVEEVK